MSSANNPYATPNNGSGRYARAYGMLFWIFGGGIGSIVASAIFVSEMFPRLTPSESCILGWSIGIPLAITAIVVGYFATANARVRKWSIIGFVALFVVMRLTTYFV